MQCETFAQNCNKYDLFWALHIKMGYDKNLRKKPYEGQSNKFQNISKIVRVIFHTLIRFLWDSEIYIPKHIFYCKDLALEWGKSPNFTCI